MKRLLALICVFALLAGLMAGCGGNAANEQTPTQAQQNAEVKPTEQPAEEKKESVFKVGISYMPDNLAPIGGYDNLIVMTRPLYDALQIEVNGVVHNFLADSIELSEDGTVYTVNINKNANWSDGKPVVAEDIIFTVNYYNETAGSASPYGFVLGQPVVYEAVDAKTLKVTLPMANNSFTGTLAGIRPMPSHPFEGDLAKLDLTYFANPDMATSGAYKVEAVNEDSFVCVKRDDYYRGTAKVDKVIMKTIGSGTTMQMAFESKEIDYINVTTVQELEKYQADPEHYNVYSIPQGRINFLVVNPKSEVLANDDARKALFLALNVQEMVDAAYGSEALGTVATQYLTPQQTPYNPAIKGYEQNLEEAKALAKTSGLEGATLNYVYNTERAGMEQVAVVIQQQLKEIGVTVNIIPTDNTAFLAKWGEIPMPGETASFDIMTQGFGELVGPSLGIWNTLFMAFADNLRMPAEVKMNAAAAMGIADAEQLRAVATTIQEAAMTANTIYPISNTSYVIVSHKNVTGLDAVPFVPEFVDYLAINVE